MIWGMVGQFGTALSPVSEDCLLNFLKMTKVDCEDCYEKFTSKKLYINHVKSKTCTKAKVKNRQRTGQLQQEAATQGAKRVRLEGEHY